MSYTQFKKYFSKMNNKDRFSKRRINLIFYYLKRGNNIVGLLITASLFIFSKNKNEITCSSFSVENCPKECVICPPCIECSSISCQTEKFCNEMGFNKDWYDKNVKRNQRGLSQ